ncbi:MAG: phosphatase PAP2 family protein [Dehalococcoidia bacterium]|nr:phosphatase PAP2 family protein [Dehalococcoidia bacterium]
MTERLPGDLTASVWLQEHAGGLDGVMRAASAAGDSLPAAGLIIVVAAALYFRGQRAYAMTMPVLAATMLAIPALKTLIGRPRPSADLVQVMIEESGRSLPSGHALSMALAMGAVICQARPLCGKQTWLVWPLRMAAAAAALTVGTSRIYLGVHWTSDVLGGFLLGGLMLFAGVLLYQEIAGSGRGRGKGTARGRGSAGITPLPPALEPLTGADLWGCRSFRAHPTALCDPPHPPRWIAALLTCGGRLDDDEWKNRSGRPSL